MSLLNVVISNFFLFKIAVTVPCVIPVSITLIFSFVSLFFISLGSSEVARSISSTNSPHRVFRIHPPTNLTLLSSPFLFKCEKIF